jgi:hypothetical protein
VKSKKFQAADERVPGIPFCLFTLAYLLALAACAVPHVPSRTVYEDPINFVRLELDHRVLADRPETGHTHPAMVGTDEMATILKGIHVKDRRLRVHIWIAGEAPVEPAFTETEIELLASKLSDALSKARPEERVTYYLSSPQTSMKRQITSGGLYVQGGELHFTLSNNREIYGIPTYGMVYDRRYPVLPIAPKDFEVLFEPAQAVVRKPFSLWDAIWGLEKDDIVLDLGKLNSPDSVAASFAR